MEGLTKTYGSMILVTDAVKKDIYKTTGGNGDFEFRYLDDVKVKGKEKALAELPDDKAANLMLERCIEFEKNPPENWDGAITFHTK